MSEPTDEELVLKASHVWRHLEWRPGETAEDYHLRKMRAALAAVAPLLRRRVLWEVECEGDVMPYISQQEGVRAVVRRLERAATPEPAAPTCDGSGLIRNGDGHRGAEYCAGCPRCAPEETP